MSFFISGCLSGADEQKSDPVIVENAVAFIKRPLVFDGNMTATSDLREPGQFRPGARLFIKDRAARSAEARDITSAAFADPVFLDDDGRLRYDVRDLEVSPDGSRLLFAMRAPQRQDSDDEPTWNIWEYDTDTDQLSRLIASDTIAAEGQDLAPAYLPDGRIVFSSTRQRTARAVLLDEGKPQFAALDEDRGVPAYLLHVMAGDGSDIRQITFNQSHDLDPMVQADGRILFSRWDNAGRSASKGISLYQVNPDGSGLSYLYGRHSHDAMGGDDDLQFVRAVETAPGELLVQARPFASTDLSILPLVVDAGRHVEAQVTVEGLAGDGQQALVAGLAADGEAGLNGQYGAVAPLFDGTDRYLVSWSPCRLVAADAGADPVNTNCTAERLASDDYAPAAPVYGLWILDTATATQLPIEPPVEGQQYDEAVLMKARPLADFLAPPVRTGEARTLAEAGYGVVHIRSVYDIDGVDTAPGGIAATADPVQTAPAQRPARFVRIEKPVSQPDDEVRDIDNSAFGPDRAQLMREILGYAPVEPDGSVRIAVPANVAFAISVLDADGQRISPRHQNWLQLQAGETLTCKGCHDPASDTPHGRPDAGPVMVNTGASTTGLEFPNTLRSLVADMGETMAQTITRVTGVRRLTADIVYDDDWTDPALATPGDSFHYAYADLETPAPIPAVCGVQWSATCRIVIHYESHIHPLWSLERRILADDGITVAEDFTCTGCHAATDAMGALQVPDAQLDLGDGQSPQVAQQFNAYRELLFADNAQEIVDGALVDQLVDTGEFERDEDGELILDAEGNPIPILAPVTVAAPMRAAGARASGRFLDRFRAGGSHEGFLSAAELRLISEWLDLGAQYYNDPFAAPED